MSSSNGVDLGSLAAMVRDILEGQQAFRRDMAARLDDHSRILNEHGLELRQLRKDVTKLDQDVATLRQAVVSCHASVVGHGIFISDPESRVSRIEQRLSLSPN